MSFPVQNLTWLPTYAILGQSNGTNFWKSSYYNSGSNIEHSKILNGMLATHYGSTNVLDYFHSADGSALAVNSLPDWNIANIYNDEYYWKMFYQLGNSLTNGLYPDFGLRRAQGYICDMRFLLWIQGETDAGNPTFAPAYESNLTNLFTKFREDFKNPTLPILVVRLHPGIARGMVGTVRTAMNNVAAAMNDIYIVDIDDFVSTDYASPGISTNVHYSVQGLDKLVTRFYNIVVNNNL